VKGRLIDVGVDVPGEWYPGVRSPPDPEGLASLEAGKESPAGPTVKDGPCLGWGCTTSGSTTDEGRVRGAGCGELGAAALWLTDESIEVGGGS
jgi:hypothetical protein